MPNSRFAPAGLVLLLLVACSGPAEDTSSDEEADAEAAALGRDTDKTVFDDMVQTQDKARAVEGVTLGHKADLDKAMDEAEDDGADDE